MLLFRIRWFLGCNKQVLVDRGAYQITKHDVPVRRLGRTVVGIQRMKLGNFRISNGLKVWGKSYKTKQTLQALGITDRTTQVYGKSALLGRSIALIEMRSAVSVRVGTRDPYRASGSTII